MLIYKHTCTITNESYIGKTYKTMEERWEEHKKSSLKYNSNSHFHRAIRKYGPDYFISEILEENIPSLSILESKQELINEREKFLYIILILF